MKIDSKVWLAVLCCLYCLWGTQARAAEPRVAVSDLAYEERVSEYFRTVSAHSKSSAQSRSSERERSSDFSSSYSGRSQSRAEQESSYYESEGYYTYIDRGELRNYTADLKGALLRSGLRLVQARPYSGQPTEKIFDVINRIKQGMFPGADYVLFGTVSNIAFRQESMPLAQGTSVTVSLALDLVVDFSLIDTHNYQVRAAFSASGSGVDTRILSRPGDRVAFNRGKVIQETSRSLAEAASTELAIQLGLPSAPPRSGMVSPPAAGIPAAPVLGPLIVY
jgi:hypothetical protein